MIKLTLFLYVFVATFSPLFIHRIIYDMFVSWHEVLPSCGKSSFRGLVSGMPHTEAQKQAFYGSFSEMALSIFQGHQTGLGAAAI